jgi:Spy/CpxP family protein refolding chaperone
MKKSHTVFWICGLVLAAAVGFFASSALFCREVPPPPPMDFPKPEAPEADRPHKDKKADNFKHMVDSALGLSAAQIATLDSNGHACDSIRKEMRAKIHEKEKRLHDLLDADSINEAELQVVRMELLILNEKRLDARIADVRFFKSQLTSEQKKKLREFSPEAKKLPPPAPKK